MKQVLMMALLALCCSFAFADTSTLGSGAGAGQNTAVTSTAQSNAANQGNSQQITFTSPEKSTTDVNTAVSGGTDSTIRQTFGTQVVRNTPSVSGPPLVSSNDTCMGSASGGINAPGFGLSLGKTYNDDNCVMLKNSRELWNMGMKGAAMALMCNDTKNKEALELTGYECPQTTRDRHGNVALQRAVQPSQEQYTDPIVRARLGLPPLTK